MSIIKPHVMIVPGNGATNVYNSNWYSYMKVELEKSGKFDSVILQNMPDPIHAKENIWVPYIKSIVDRDNNIVLIGHSSGAEAIMRLLEETVVLGVILIAACHTDLGDESERNAGIFHVSISISYK